MVTDKDKKFIEERFKEISEKAINSANATVSALQSTVDDMDGKNAFPSAPVYKAAAVQALSDACNNAVHSQQQANVTAQAATTQGILYCTVLLQRHLAK